MEILEVFHENVAKQGLLYASLLTVGGVRTEGRGAKSQEYPYIASGLVLTTGSDSCIDIKLHGVLAILYPSSCPNKPN